MRCIKSFKLWIQSSGVYGFLKSIWFFKSLYFPKKFGTWWISRKVPRSYMYSFNVEWKYLGIKSEIKTVYNEVAQGVTLGPLLFLYRYITWITLQIILSSYNFVAGRYLIIYYTNCWKLTWNVLQWLTVNKLRINLKKHIILFSNKCGDRAISITIRKKVLEQKNNSKFWGPYNNKNLN